MPPTYSAGVAIAKNINEITGRVLPLNWQISTDMSAKAAGILWSRIPRNKGLDLSFPLLNPCWVSREPSKNAWKHNASIKNIADWWWCPLACACKWPCSTPAVKYSNTRCMKNPASTYSPVLRYENKEVYKQLESVLEHIQSHFRTTPWSPL